MSIRFAHISSVDWSSKLGAFGEIVEAYDDIRQCIDIILLTVKGSVPHRLDFGTDIYKYIDLPAKSTIPHLIYEATKAIEKWEPRAVVETVEVRPVEAHHFQIVVTWSPKDGNSDQTIVQEVNL